jgi:hypothetical protein
VLGNFVDVQFAMSSSNPGSPSLVPDESSDERYSRELLKLLRKLRWIGEDGLAKELETKLRLNQAFAGPSDKD